MSRPLVAVSACLLGDRVRYDGRDQSRPWIGALAAEFELLRVCPEVEIGLGVPRPPIQMVAGGQLRRVGGGPDLAPAVSSLAQRRAAELAPRLRGYVLKARSPSCGLDAPVFASAAAGAEVVERAPGRFAAAIRARFPDLPMADDEELADERRREAFAARVRARARRP